MSGKKGYIVRNQRNKNQLLFLTFILRTFDKNFAQLHHGRAPFPETISGDIAGGERAAPLGILL